MTDVHTLEVQVHLSLQGKVPDRVLRSIGDPGCLGDRGLPTLEGA